MVEVFHIDPLQAAVAKRIKTMYVGWERAIRDLVPPENFEPLVIEVLGNMYRLPEDRWEELRSHPMLSQQALHNIAEQAFGVSYGLSVRSRLLNHGE